MGLFLASKLTRLALGAAQTALAAGEAYRTGKKIEKRVREALRPQKEDVITMKKSTFAAILVFFAAIAGALTAAYMYLRRREASWMNMSNSCSVRISAMRNLRRKKPPQRTRRMTPRMTSRFKRGRSAASETENAGTVCGPFRRFNLSKNFAFPPNCFTNGASRACGRSRHPILPEYSFTYASFNAAKRLLSLHASGGICSVLFDKGMG